MEAIGAVTLVTQDMARAVRFSRELGLTIRHGGGQTSFTSFPAGAGSLNLIAQPVRQPGSWGRVIFHVSDGDAFHARAVAAAENGLEPRQVSFKGAKQAVTAFAPKIEAARPEDRPALIDAPLAVIAYHRVGDRPRRWEPRATKRRPKRGARLNQPRAEARLPENRSKWF